MTSNSVAPVRCFGRLAFLGLALCAASGFSQALEVSGNRVFIESGTTTPLQINGTVLPVSGTGSSKSALILLRNIAGAGTLNVTGYVVTGPDASSFNVNGNAMSLSPGDSNYISVNFAPISGGLKSATINVLSNDLSHPSYSFAVQGQGFLKFGGPYVDLAPGAGTAIMKLNSKTGLYDLKFKGVISNPTLGSSLGGQVLFTAGNDIIVDLNTSPQLGSTTFGTIKPAKELDMGFKPKLRKIKFKRQGIDSATAHLQRLFMFVQNPEDQEGFYTNNSVFYPITVVE